jgi:hypothetical protein
MPVPIPLKTPYSAIKLARFLVKLEANMPDMAILPPSKIMALGFQLLYLRRYVPNWYPTTHSTLKATST